MHVKKHLKQLEQIFYGSSLSYDTALAGEGPSLPDALLKNVYDNDAAKKPQAEALARYLLSQLECLRLTNTAALMKGHFKFG